MDSDSKYESHTVEHEDYQLQQDIACRELCTDDLLAVMRKDSMRYRDTMSIVYVASEQVARIAVCVATD